MVSKTDSGLIFADKTFTNHHGNVKFVKIFPCEINPLYGTFFSSMMENSLEQDQIFLYHCLWFVLYIVKKFSIPNFSTNGLNGL